MDYLSFEEQFKEILNNEEIGRIEDSELRSIRWKYWKQTHNAIQDEHGIPDHRLGEKMDEIRAREVQEIEEYKKRKGFK